MRGSLVYRADVAAAPDDQLIVPLDNFATVRILKVLNKQFETQVGGRYAAVKAGGRKTCREVITALDAIVANGQDASLAAFTMVKIWRGIADGLERLCDSPDCSKKTTLASLRACAGCRVAHCASSIAAGPTDARRLLCGLPEAVRAT